MEKRIEILDRVAKRFGEKKGIGNFKEFIEFMDSESVIAIVRIAMADYALQEVRNQSNPPKQ